MRRIRMMLMMVAAVALMMVVAAPSAMAELVSVCYEVEELELVDGEREEVDTIECDLVSLNDLGSYSLEVDCENGVCETDLDADFGVDVESVEL